MQGRTVKEASCRVRLLLVDPLVLFRASLSWILSAEPDLEVAGECGTALEALEILRNAAESPIDLILLDLHLGSAHAADLIEAARAEGYKGRFLIVTGSSDARSLAIALKSGALGIFLKSDPPERLIEAVKRVMSGDAYVDRNVIQLIASQLIERWPESDLGYRQRKVLKGVVSGLSNRSIGNTLGMSETAVKNTVQKLFNKTGVRNRSQLVRIAMEGSLNPGAGSAGAEIRMP
jgi:DNA-binding NarL/FixJ family response regulator